jgi:hypothetical protein
MSQQLRFALPRRSSRSLSRVERQAGSLASRIERGFEDVACQLADDHKPHALDTAVSVDLTVSTAIPAA